MAGLKSKREIRSIRVKTEGKKLMKDSNKRIVMKVMTEEARKIKPSRMKRIRKNKKSNLVGNKFLVKAKHNLGIEEKTNLIMIRLILNHGLKTRSAKIRRKISLIH